MRVSQTPPTRTAEVICVGNIAEPVRGRGYFQLPGRAEGTIEGERCAPPMHFVKH
jgi:hypothetical protein